MAENMNDESPQSLMTEETTKALASLFTASSEKQIGQLETLLQELGSAQNELMELIPTGSDFFETREMREISEIMGKVPLYSNKLATVRRDMLALHERASKLKKRALKAQEKNEQKTIHEEKVQAKQQAKEESLLARPAEIQVIRSTDDKSKRKKSKPEMRELGNSAEPQEPQQPSPASPQAADDDEPAAEVEQEAAPAESEEQ